jgi:anti-sigma factor RsiW
MDHNDALRLQAAEKYLLGEFPQNLRDEYEEHFFDCAECALDVKAMAAFADTAREIMRRDEEAASEKVPVPAVGLPPLVQTFSGWHRWFQPVLVPAFCLLLLLASYQNLVSIPHWRGATARAEQRATLAAQASVPHVLPTFSLMGANRRGGGGPVFQAASGKSFILKTDIPETEASATSSYLLRLKDASGTSYPLGTVSREEARNTVFVEVPAGFPAGNAQLVVLEITQPGATPREITTLPFVVAFRPDFEQHP